MHGKTALSILKVVVPMTRSRVERFMSPDQICLKLSLHSRVLMSWLVQVP